MRIPSVCAALSRLNQAPEWTRRPTPSRTPAAAREHPLAQAMVIERIRGCEESALAAAHDPAAGRAYRVASAFVRCERDAAEISCGVYLPVWQSPHNYPAERAAAMGWPLFLTRTRARDFHRRWSTQRAAQLHHVDAAATYVEGPTQVADWIIMAIEGGSLVYFSPRELPVAGQETRYIGYRKIRNRGIPQEPGSMTSGTQSNQSRSLESNSRDSGLIGKLSDPGAGLARRAQRKTSTFKKDHRVKMRSLCRWLLFAGLTLPIALQATLALADDEPDTQVTSPTPEMPGSSNILTRSDKLVLTGGVSQVEGAAGGGLTPWAIIGGYGTHDQIGANAFYTRVNVQDYHLDVAGALVGIYDRVEFSFAQQRFNTEDVGAALGIGRGLTFRQNILGVKVKVAGDAVLEQDRWLPQISVGLQYKKNDQGAVLDAFGAKNDSGTDFYVSATKLYLGQSLLLNGTLRLTKANQLGLLGFGGDRNDRYQPEFEGSFAYLVRRDLAIGAEFRTKPNNLGIAKEDDWYDAFIAWAPTKNVSVTLAYAYLGNVVIRDNQRGLYASVQVGF